jgi:DNA-binding CsgD family transcriptional regulator
MQRISRLVGYDGGWFHTMDSKYPVASGSWNNYDLSVVERGRIGWPQYARQIEPLRQMALASGGVGIDTEAMELRDRERIPFYVEILRPLGMAVSMWTHLVVRNEEVAVIGLSLADRGRQFSPKAVELMRSLAPVLSVCDGIFKLREPDQTVEIPIPRITDRQREIVELVALGYTNTEIGLALGLSMCTVRNHLTEIYQKVGATRRAELTSLYLKAQRSG